MEGRVGLGFDVACLKVNCDLLVLLYSCNVHLRVDAAVQGDILDAVVQRLAEGVELLFVVLARHASLRKELLKADKEVCKVLS